MKHTRQATLLVHAAAALLGVLAGTSCARFSDGKTQTLVMTQMCGSIPAKPTGILVSSSVAPASVTVSWTPNLGCFLADATVVRKTGSVPQTSTDGQSISLSGSGFVDSTVTGGSIYYYRLYNRDLYGRLSDPATVSVIPGTAAAAPTYVTTPIAIDGSDSDAAWAGAAQIPFSFNQAYGESAGADPVVSGYVRLAYDATYFYFFYSVNDKYVWVDGTPGQPWLDDSVEVFFDMDFTRTAGNTPDTKDFQLIFTPTSTYWFHGRGNNTTSYNSAWTPSATIATIVNGTVNNNADTDTGFTIEVRIPFTDLGISGITPGQTIGFTFSPNDDDTVGHAAQHSYKWTTGSVYNQESTWGTCQF